MKPEPVTLEQRIVGEKKLVFALREWPECAVIAPAVLRDKGGIVSIDDDGMIVMRVENGYAAYKLSKEQLNDYGVTVELSDGSWSPAPESQSKTENP